MTQAASQLGFTVRIYDPAANCPAAQVTHHAVTGSFDDAHALSEFIRGNTITTYDLEHINTAPLFNLESAGHKIYPQAYVLDIIQDKEKQKNFLIKHAIPTAPLIPIDKINEFPVILKICKGGYDGRGVFTIRSQNDLLHHTSLPFFLEKKITFESELAVMVARDATGHITTYQTVEMTFHSDVHICDMIIAPARISPELDQAARELAIRCIEALGGVGVFGVELFLTPDHQLLVNEIAPRPHNSGHHTVEACYTSQFEQHIRAITGLPLGDTKLLMPSVMVNLLGEPGNIGKPVITGLDSLQLPGVNLHIYGKSETKPFRKMGHVTIIDPNIDRALIIAHDIKTHLKITSKGRLT